MSLKLIDVCDYSDEKIRLSDLGVSNYVTTDNLLANKMGKVDATNLPPQDTNVIKFKVGNILVSNIRPYLKKIWFASHNGGNSADVLTFKVKKGFDEKFVYYSLFRDDFFKHMMNGSTGTKMPRGDKNQILDFIIPDIRYNEQIKISKILSDLDAKIKLNTKINAELDSIVKTIYEYWFVQFDFPDTNGKPYKASGGKMVYNKILKKEIPEDWQDKTIADWIENDKSGDWGEEFVKGNYKLEVNCIRGADINGLIGDEEIKAPIRFILENNRHKVLEKGDIIIEISGGSPTQSTGRMAFITQETLERFENPLICSNFCKAVTLKDETYLYNFVYQWNRIYDAGVLFGWEGKTSGIKNLLFESFVTNYKTVFPQKDIVEKFYQKVKPLHAKKQKNLQENQKLAELRDWLLPMLMNGQVTVKEAQEHINKAAEPQENYG